jgi:hypothetical protein
MLLTITNSRRAGKIWQTESSNRLHWICDGSMAQRAASSVQFRHVTSGAAAWNLVANGAMPVNGPRRTVSGKTGDVEGFGEENALRPARLKKPASK